MDETGHDCHGHGINQMPDLPTKISGSHCAQSEIISPIPNGINSISNLGILDNDDEELLSMLENLENFNSSFEELSQLLEGKPSEPPSMEAADPPPPPPPPPPPTPPSDSQNESLTLRCDERLKLRQRHKHSQSMDESSSFNSEHFTLSMRGPPSMEKRKAKSMEKLVNIALVDPKRAKRIWANRQSAIRSKERKMQYTVELERNVQALQTEANILTTQISLLRRDIVGLSAENTKLKLQLQSVEQQIHFQDALNNTLVEEIKRLRIAMGHMSSNFRAMTNLGELSVQELQQLYYHTQALQPLFSKQETQILPQHQLTLQEHQAQLQKIVYMQQDHQAPTDLKMKGPMT
ncbi:probable transcription factor PosF21 [Typha latifolia]|uniref:probable transcription factor PosF21 n=1 Tax=Typha latifolia TaxID=4733 RepID=UPI003C2D03DC